MRTKRYGPAITRRVAVAAGSGVPPPRVDMAAADQIPSALAITSTAIPTRSDHDGSGATTRKEPQKTAICRAVAVTCREVGALASAGRAANGPISAHRVGSRPRSSRAQATRDPRAAAAMMTTPIPASVVKVAYAASATATRSVHVEATTAAHRIPAAASADPTTNSGTSSSARGSGSSEPSVATRTAGTRGRRSTTRPRRAPARRTRGAPMCARM
ncbi:hypothetical protein BC477_06110 [Clavibacter michiganensis subsp. michiganensis]|uniref:Uncharacterized protein n=1 Tax=Clavibacter michiganensis subsp. michiganensis TaxID=33013 RepID=A0A251XLL0_CLAMM|nr:hypothetical protein BC477_06110 [Clavibacter michiganensis subsp. michiganensis]OUE04290.1 hypothetical protein CMMCAS07_05040 [Clavibacter michiganensis subsp. michiganensis]